MLHWGLGGLGRTTRGLGGLLFQKSFLDQKHHRLGARGTRRDYGGTRGGLGGLGVIGGLGGLGGLVDWGD